MAEKLNQGQPGHHMSRRSFIASVGVKSNPKENKASISYQLGTLGKYLAEVTNSLSTVRQNKNDNGPSEVPSPAETKNDALNFQQLAKMGNEFMKSVISSIQEEYLAAKELMLKGEISDKKSRLDNSDPEDTQISEVTDAETNDQAPENSETRTSNQTSEIPETSTASQIPGTLEITKGNQASKISETRPENHFIFPLRELGKTGNEINQNLEQGLENAGGRVLDIEDNNFVSQFKGKSNSNGLSITQGVNGDCANAALLMAARSAGMMQGDSSTANSDLQKVREFVKPGSNQFQGVDLQDVIRGGRKLGFDTRTLNGTADDVISELNQYNKPMVAVNPMEYGALKEKKGHLVLVKDYNSETDKFTLYDSLFQKPIEVSRDNLQRAMKTAGKHSNTIVSLGMPKNNNSLTAQNNPPSSSDNPEYLIMKSVSSEEKSTSKVYK